MMLYCGQKWGINMSSNQTESNNIDENILGLQTSELAGLSIDEITGNKVAITMIMHYYKQLVDENNALKNEKNTLNTYVQAYEAKKSNSTTGNILLIISNICIGFGVNLITGGSIWPGIASMISGLSLAIAGIYFTFIKE